MSDAAAVSAPAAAPAPAPGANPSVGAPESVTQHKASSSDRKAAATARIEAARAAKGAPAQAAPAVAPPAATPPVAPPKPPTPPTPPTQPGGQDVEKLIRNAVAQDRENYELKQRLKDLEGKAKSFEERETKLKGMTPLELWEANGHSYDQVNQDIVKGKYQPKSAAELAAEKAHGVAQTAQERIEALEKRLAERDSQARAHSEQLYLREEIGKAAEQFPLLAAFDWAPGSVREAYNARIAEAKKAGAEPPPLTDVLSSVQGHVEADIQAMLANPGARKWLQDRLAEALGDASPATNPEESSTAPLGTQPQSTGSRNDPAALTRVAAQDAGTRRSGGTRSTPSQRKANAVAAVLRARSAKP